MKDIITITSKGQTTLPAAIRRKLGVGAEGGKLQIAFDEQKNQLVISKPMTLKELQQKANSYVKPGVAPLEDVGGYYQAHRNTQ